MGVNMLRILQLISKNVNDYAKGKTLTQKGF